MHVCWCLGCATRRGPSRAHNAGDLFNQVAFKKMDDNGGGIVLLDEWCWFIKQAEVAAGTDIGKLLALDEAGGVGKAEKLAAGKAKVTATPKKSPRATPGSHV